MGILYLQLLIQLLNKARDHLLVMMLNVMVQQRFRVDHIRYNLLLEVCNRCRGICPINSLAAALVVMSSSRVLVAVFHGGDCKALDELVFSVIELLYLAQAVLGRPVDRPGQLLGRVFQLVCDFLCISDPGGIVLLLAAVARRHGRVRLWVGAIGMADGTGAAVGECHEGDTGHGDARQAHSNGADHERICDVSVERR